MQNRDKPANGMTKREYAAIHAMQGLLSRPDVNAACEQTAAEEGIDPAMVLAELAAHQVDCLFDELEATQRVPYKSRGG